MIPMPKKGLSVSFQPNKYQLHLDGDACQLVLSGKKLPPPSKRITLHQKGLKVAAVQIVRRDKKGDQQFTVARINYLPTFEQVRLHTKEILYPGIYQIDLKYKLTPEKLNSLMALGQEKPHRDLMPCIDEPEAWINANFEIK